MGWMHVGGGADSASALLALGGSIVYDGVLGRDIAESAATSHKVVLWRRQATR